MVQILVRLIPDLLNLKARFLIDPEAFTNNIYGSEDAATEPVVTGEHVFHPAAVTNNPATALERRRTLARVQRTLEKITQVPADVSLDSEEGLDLEAIVQAYGRPAICIQHGDMAETPQEWLVLNQYRNEIRKAVQSVGRIEVEGHPRLEWIGTGFLAAKDVVMTNRHVANEFCSLNSEGRWEIINPIQASINFLAEHGSIGTLKFAIQEVIGVHTTLDLALFRIATTSNDGTLPSPIPIASVPPADICDRTVYAVGYPAQDGRRNDPTVMLNLFSRIFDVKRLQPGKIIDVDDNRQFLFHDCSTLGGNSGSCIVDLETGAVLGLHFGGKYLDKNYAVALWQLQRDPLLLKAGVIFEIA
jgi:hypothetical protein